MDITTVSARIAELEVLEAGMNDTAALKRIELAGKEAEAAEIRKAINENQFTTTEAYKELLELRTVRKWLERQV